MNNFAATAQNIVSRMEGLLVTPQKDFYNKIMSDFPLFCKITDGDNCHLRGVNEAFFTKFFHFYFEANKSKNKSTIHPIICDKWLRTAVCADMISKESKLVDTCFEIKDNTANFPGAYFKHAAPYCKMVDYYNDRVNRLREKSQKLTPYNFESYLLFGQAPVNGICPRCEAIQILQQYQIKKK